MRAHSLRLLVPALLAPAILPILALGCDHLQTESGDFGVSFSDFVHVPSPSPFPVAEGTLLCDPDPRCDACESPDESVAPICEDLSLTIEGAVAENGCYPVGLAPITFTFTPQMCSSAVAAESLEVRGVPLSQVEGQLNGGFFEEHSITTYLGSAIEVFGDPLLSPEGQQPLQIFADERPLVDIILKDSVSERTIGWNPGRSSMSINTLEGAPFEVEYDLPSFYAEASAGARSSATLTLDSVDIDLPDIVAVDEGAIDHIALTAVFSDEGDDGQRPFGLEAHVMDADGKAIAGVPVEWRIVEGALYLKSTQSPGTYADVGECTPRRHKDSPRAVVEASFGGHSTSLEIEWRAYQGPDDYLPPECADEGCGCRSSAPSGWGGLLLGVLLLMRRRTHRREQG